MAPFSKLLRLLFLASMAENAACFFFCFLGPLCYRCIAPQSTLSQLPTSRKGTKTRGRLSKYKKSFSQLSSKCQKSNHQNSSTCTWLVSIATWTAKNNLWRVVKPSCRPTFDFHLSFWPFPEKKRWSFPCQAAKKRLHSLVSFLLVRLSNSHIRLLHALLVRGDNAIGKNDPRTVV